LPWGALGAEYVAEGQVRLSKCHNFCDFLKACETPAPGPIFEYIAPVRPIGCLPKNHWALNQRDPLYEKGRGVTEFFISSQQCIFAGIEHTNQSRLVH
jgi:hypothetical protein